MSLLRFAWDSLNHPVRRLIHDNGSVMSNASAAAPPERVAEGSAGLLRGVARALNSRQSTRQEWAVSTPAHRDAGPPARSQPINDWSGFRFRHFIVRGRQK